jgi:hypothetical protein
MNVITIVYKRSLVGWGWWFSVEDIFCMMEQVFWVDGVLALTFSNNANHDGDELCCY